MLRANPSVISLILRARQVVVFGNEYQYGAVSAVHVSAKYSASFVGVVLKKRLALSVGIEASDSFIINIKAIMAVSMMPS